METERNIAELARNHGSFYHPDKGLPIDGLGMLPFDTPSLAKDLGFFIYGNHEGKKGSWGLYSRENWTPPSFLDDSLKPINSFLGIYSTKNQRDMILHRTMVLVDMPVGSEHEYFDDHLHRGNVRDTLDAVTTHMLEQKGTFRHPRKLTEKDELDYISNRRSWQGLLAMAILAGYTVDTYFGIHVGTAIRDFSDSFLGASGNYVKHGVFVLPAAILGLAMIHRPFGITNDLSRALKLPTYANDFLYGSEALAELRRQHSSMKIEEEKIKIHLELTQGPAPSLSKQDFLLMYDFIKGTKDFAAIASDFQRLKKQTGLTIDQIIEAFRGPSPSHAP